jgi:hypothetical protein
MHLRKPRLSSNAQILARNGVKLKVLPSSGSLQNLAAFK